MILFGAIGNAVLVILGTIVGLILKDHLKENYQDSVVRGLGLVVIYIAISSFNLKVNSFNVLISMAIGAIIGELFDLDGKVHAIADRLQKRFGKGDGGFAAGFTEATLIFCVGSMTIIGAIESGLQNNHSTQLIKGAIDGITAIFLTAKHGVGVGFSSLAILLYQGGLTLASSLLKPILTTACMNHINVVGGIILLTVSFNVCGIAKFKSMNYVPALIITVILTLVGLA